MRLSDRTALDHFSDLDFSSGASVADRAGTNHCFDGWHGSATVNYQHAPHRILFRGCPARHSVIVVYVPEGADYFCVEPVTHAVNALNLPSSLESGMWTLAPQEARDIALSIPCDTTGEAASRSSFP